MDIETLKSVALCCTINGLTYEAFIEKFMSSEYGTNDLNMQDDHIEHFISNQYDTPIYRDSDAYNLDYLVLTDDEADEAWEENLNSYLEECVYPEIAPPLRGYFDDEKWKRDAKYDGRGHSLSTYDGTEIEFNNEHETIYLYRTN